MKKKKKKYANLIMLLLILFVLFFIVLQNRPAKVTVEMLIESYSSNISDADKNFLNKDLELTGNVKLLFQFEGEKSLLELESPTEKLKVYCIIMNKEIDEKLSMLTAGTPVKVYGKCLGLKDYKFPNSIYIEVEQIK